MLQQGCKSSGHKKSIMKNEWKIRSFISPLWLLVLVSTTLAEKVSLREGFRNPPMDCRPHTFWFWPFTAVSEDEITWELQQMRDHGLGGVLIWSAFKVYEKGSFPYLSREYIALLKHTMKTAQSLGLEVSMTPGPGFSMGGPWVPPEERSQSLIASYFDLYGPQLYSANLPAFVKAADHRGEIRVADIPDSDKLIAVLAARIVDGILDLNSVVNLADNVRTSTLSWQVPEGQWRIMAFRLKRTGYRVTPLENEPGTDFWGIDYFNKNAVAHYCDYLLGEQFGQALGEYYGNTLESFFIDSFELPNLPNGIYWSDSLLAEFKKVKSYDLIPFLPALWFETGELTPKIRYDVNEFLHQIGMETFFKTFLAWCANHGVNGAIEPYGFTTDVLQGSGTAHVPIMEITPGEKDAVPWFDTRVGPRRYVASGAHLYGKKVLATEAYTYIHWELFRSTLEELKIASDGFLTADASKFYHLGYSYSPEREVTPSRIVPWEAVISHHNIWWQYYPLLADYVARCCWMLRQGQFVADVALYSPLANQWTLNVFNARKWTRDFDWGDLGKLLIANGYNFDLINDDILQHKANSDDGKINVAGLSYPILILPDIQAMPLASLEWIRNFAWQGGVVIALERVPNSSVGLRDFQRQDQRVQALTKELFKTPQRTDDTAMQAYGRGWTYYIKSVLHRQDVLDRHSSTLDPFVNTLRRHVVPDVGIDFALYGMRENNGLTFVHHTLHDSDLYFVTNVQDRSSEVPLTFRVRDKVPWHWNPYNGEMTRLFCYEQTSNGIRLPLKLSPYESMFILFIPEVEAIHVVQTDLAKVTSMTSSRIDGWAEQGGEHRVLVNECGRNHDYRVDVINLPAPLQISGTWRMVLEDAHFTRLDTLLQTLFSWTHLSRTRHFSGTGYYKIDFDLPAEYVAKDLVLLLDLGRVGDIAEVKLNQKSVGITWMRGQKLDITGMAKNGKNSLAISVTNTLINRVAGMKEPPPVPDHLTERYGSGTTWYTANVRGPLGFQALPASGLLGPVDIYPLKKVSVKLAQY